MRFLLARLLAVNGDNYVTELVAKKVKRLLLTDRRERDGRGTWNRTTRFEKGNRDW